jgi:hypothetical protein
MWLDRSCGLVSWCSARCGHICLPSSDVRLDHLPGTCLGTRTLRCPNHHPAAHSWVCRMTSMVSLGAVGNTVGFRGHPGTESSITQSPSFLLLWRFRGRRWTVWFLHVGVLCRVGCLLGVYNDVVCENEIIL